MSTNTDTKQVAVRISAQAHERLVHATSLLKTTQAAFIEEGILLACEKHGLNENYELYVGKTELLLVRVEGQERTPVEVVSKNSVPPKEIAKHYTAKYHCPVVVKETKR